MSTLGYKIRKLRKENNLTQTELGQKLSIKKSTISKYENDINIPATNILNKMADIFNVPLDYLLNETSNKTSNVDYNNYDLNKKDIKDIEKSLDSIMNDLDNLDDSILYNGPLDQIDKSLIKNAFNHALVDLKIKNKEKYTPKKYKNNFEILP